MSSFLQVVNIDENFWDLNPEVKYMTPFNELYKQENSSKIMWSLYLYLDPDSRFYRMETEEKEKEIVENYLELEDNIFRTEEMKILLEAYSNKLLSKLQKSYNRLLKKLEERDNFIASTKYNEKNAKALDTMFANSSIIYKQLTEIGDELQSEKRAGSIKGGRKESLSERRII